MTNFQGKLTANRGRWLALMSALVIIVECGLSAPPTGTPSLSAPATPTALAPADTPPPETAAEPSAWEQVLNQIEPDGTVSAETALQAFSLAIGPLPGVTVPTGPAQPILSGSGAIRWLVGHWSEISAAQRAEAVRLRPDLAGLDSAPPAEPRQPKRLPETNSSAVATVRPPTYYAALAEVLAGEIEAQTGLHLDLPIFAAEANTQSATAAAETWGLNAQGGLTGQAAKCKIVVSATGAAEAGQALEMIIAHEVWHCYQFQVRSLDWMYATTTPSWLIEGQAAWAGLALRPVPGGWGFWAQYILSPEKPLFTRSYDAFGFYAHLSQAQVNPWDVLITMLQVEDSNPARFEVAGANADQFLDTLASTYFRQAALGPAWELAGPGLLDAPTPIRKVLTASNGNTTPFSAPAYTNRLFSLSSSADVLRFAVAGHVRLGDPGNNQDYIPSSGLFCTKDGGCACPPGLTFGGAPPTPLSAESLLAVTGGVDGTNGTVAGLSLEDACHKADGTPWSMVFWSPDLGDTAPPIFLAYTCDGLESTWHAIYLPGGGPVLERSFDLPFDTGLVVHQDVHQTIPPDKESPETQVDFALDFELDPTADPPVIVVTGTKTESQVGVVASFPPREFGSDAPLPLLNVALETQLQPYPKYQHPFRAQALAECGG